MSERSPHVYIVFSPDNQLHSNIVKKFSKDLQRRRPSIVIVNVTPGEKIKTIDSDTDIIIGIGGEGMKSADTHYPKIKKLFISTDPNKYKLDRDRNSNDSILYMTQAYRRQVHLIRQLNRQWKIIGILNSREKPIDSTEIRRCANEHNLKVYIVSTTVEDNITDKIRHALHHSDVLLALPDKNIYNSRTVKNILLTSYRYRKPVIAFSKNFVNAGALAAIYSDTDKIAISASKLIEQYFYSTTPIEQVNYPDAFDISINKQVFRALDIQIPDIETIKMSLQQIETDASGSLR
ncbi:MAG: hypothetical protein KJO03_06445 [Gammaproteobacteria bacterium]|nr:hypothetical protein [Gammaproteobacteria bacterium]